MDRQYKTKTLYEHIFTRHNVYIGATTPLTTERWLASTNGFEFRNCRSIPGLLKLFDEIIMNARDNAILPVNPTTVLKVELTPESLSVANNGECIPIKMQDGQYIPSHGVLHTCSLLNTTTTPKRVFLPV